MGGFRAISCLFLKVSACKIVLVPAHRNWGGSASFLIGRWATVCREWILWEINMGVGHMGDGHMGVSESHGSQWVTWEMVTWESVSHMGVSHMGVSELHGSQWVTWESVSHVGVSHMGVWRSHGSRSHGSQSWRTPDPLGGEVISWDHYRAGTTGPFSTAILGACDSD
jgi:hypothetical protein